MNNTDTTPQIKWDKENKILCVDFVGHITKDEMISVIMLIEKELEALSQTSVKALHNFQRATHISIDAQIIFSEHTRSPHFSKHAFISNSRQIKETIDIMISIMQDTKDGVKIFQNEQEAMLWLIQ